MGLNVPGIGVLSIWCLAEEAVGAGTCAESLVHHTGALRARGWSLGGLDTHLVWLSKTGV